MALFALAQQGAPPTIPSTASPGLDQYRASRIAIYTDDFGELKRYREADAALKPPAAGENRVVFLGDSITDYWKLEDYFPGKPYINRGIDGQTTPQMLVRFRQDVINLHPKVLVVLAGTNDVAGVTGPTRNEDIEANYASMAELARLHHIRVVFASLLPVNNYTEDAKESFALRPRERILALNTWLKDYCAKNGSRRISTTSQPWSTTKACSGAICLTRDCIPMRPDTKSWRRLQRRRSRKPSPANRDGA